MDEGIFNLPGKYIRTMVSMLKESGELGKLKVISGSMEPAIEKGAVIEVETEIKAIEAGDILVFLNTDHLTVHRVIRIEPGGQDGEICYITQGDAAGGGCEKVYGRDIIGKVKMQKIFNQDEGGL